MSWHGCLKEMPHAKDAKGAKEKHFIKNTLSTFSPFAPFAALACGTSSCLPLPVGEK